jgi:hypothetical protein
MQYRQTLLAVGSGLYTQLHLVTTPQLPVCTHRKETVTTLGLLGNIH